MRFWAILTNITIPSIIPCNIKLLLLFKIFVYVLHSRTVDVMWAFTGLFTTGKLGFADC